MSGFGKVLHIEIFGESHGMLVGATISHLPPNIEIDEEYIKKELEKRKPCSFESTRVEPNEYMITSGFFDGMTTGKPLTVIILNKDVNRNDYEELGYVPRPGTADLVNYLKYGAAYDFFGSGHQSGRLTTPLVVIGAICKQIVEKMGYKFLTHIKQCGSFHDIDFSNKSILDDYERLEKQKIPVLGFEEDFIKVVEEAKKNKDSLGGIVETCIIGPSRNIGNSWFDSIQGYISQIMMSIGGVKGIEFGDGFKFADETGSTANDYYSFKNETLCYETNHCGGISGGMTTGQPILFRLAVKPTPSIGKEQNTVNLVEGENTTISLKGRHDPTIVRKLCSVVNNLLGIIMLDEIMQDVGMDYIEEYYNGNIEETNKIKRKEISL